MSLERAQQIARAVLYEGYILYPYRASSTKNQQRWNFGTLYPEQHVEVQRGWERCSLQVQCLLAAGPEARLTLRILFLQLQDCEPAKAAAETACRPACATVEVPDDFGPQPWQEAVERAVDLEIDLHSLAAQPRLSSFMFPAGSAIEEARSTGVRDVKQPGLREIHCAVETSIENLDTGLFRLTVQVGNTSPVSGKQQEERAAALASALVSAHVILHLQGGRFISLQDPPRELRQAAQECRNLGMYPVLVGEPGEHDLLLGSPIILYDYPQIAPESAGDFFDATEMDEMLTLRVLTLTDEEKQEMRAGDGHARRILERTEATARQHLMRTHGTIRNWEHPKDGT